jgi:transcriptional regulator with XRE-family HTH domain
MTPADLIAWRTDRGLTSEALGALLGVSRKTVSSWENRKHPIPPYLWLALFGAEKAGLA